MGNLRGMSLSRRSASAALAGLATLLLAAPARAAVAYTGDAAPAETSATTYGYVTPQTEYTLWTFAYGTSTGYGSYTKPGVLPPGSSPKLVAAQMTKLRAGTTYHYRLFALPYTAAGQPDWAGASWGQDAIFTTTRGNLNLVSSRLVVRRGLVSIPLQCASTLACGGSITVTTRSRVGRRFNTVLCASSNFKMVAGARQTLAPRLSSSCGRLIGSARGHRLSATATARVSTGQSAPNETVTLAG